MIWHPPPHWLKQQITLHLFPLVHRRNKGATSGYHKTKNRMLCIHESHVQRSHVYQMCKNQLHMRECGLPVAVQVKNTVFFCEHWECSYTFMNRSCSHTRLDLYLDAKGSGLWAGGLSGRGGLCSRLEQSFEDGLGVHLRSGLWRGSLTGRARQGWGQAVFFCTAARAWGVAEPQ